MPNNLYVENLTKEIEQCDPRTIGDLANECIASIDPDAIEKLREKVKATCTDSEVVSAIFYYLDLCKQNISDSAPILPGMSCILASQQLRSLATLIPGEFLAGFFDGIDGLSTPFLLKKFVDPCIQSRFLQALTRCVVLSLTDSLIATFVRLPAQLGTEYLMSGELEEELPHWHTYLWNSLLLHFLINGLLFSTLEVMKACDPQSWKHRFATQLLRIRISSQVAKLISTFSWASCGTKGIVGYLINVLGQVLGHFITFSLLPKEEPKKIETRDCESEVSIDIDQRMRSINSSCRNSGTSDFFSQPSRHSNDLQAEYVNVPNLSHEQPSDAQEGCMASNNLQLRGN